MENYTIITKEQIDYSHRQVIIDSIQQSFDRGDKVLPVTLESLQNSRREWAILDTDEKIRYYCRAMPLIEIDGNTIDEFGTLIKIPQESNDLYGLAKKMVSLAASEYNQSQKNVLIATVRGQKSKLALLHGGMTEVDFDLESRAITCSPSCHPGDGNIFKHLDSANLECGACSSNCELQMLKRTDTCSAFVSNPERYQDVLRSIRRDSQYETVGQFNPQLFRKLNNL
jgi:hypothetical protein